MKHGPVVSARCILLRDSRILVQRGKRGFYRLPGGRVGDDETIVDCLRREMLEELSLEVSVGNLLYIIEAFYRNKWRLTHEIGFYFRCEAGAEPKPNESHIEVEWVPLTEEALAPMRPRILATLLLRDARTGWSHAPRYVVSFEDEYE